MIGTSPADATPSRIEAAIVLASVVPMLVVQGGLIVYANDAAARALNYRENGAPIAGLNVHSIFCPEDRAAADVNIRLVLASGVVSSGVTRRLVGLAGEPLATVQILVSIVWEGAPAVGLSFIVLANGGELQDDTGDLEGGPASRRTRTLLALSPRQCDVALLLVQGFSPVNIAAKLGLSVQTARTHIKHVYRRLNVTTRVGVVRILLDAETLAPGESSDDSLDRGRSGGACGQ